MRWSVIGDLGSYQAELHQALHSADVHQAGVGHRIAFDGQVPQLRKLTEDFETSIANGAVVEVKGSANSPYLISGAKPVPVNLGVNSPEMVCNSVSPAQLGQTLCHPGRCAGRCLRCRNDLERPGRNLVEAVPTWAVCRQQKPPFLAQPSSRHGNEVRPTRRPFSVRFLRRMLRNSTRSSLAALLWICRAR